MIRLIRFLLALTLLLLPVSFTACKTSPARAVHTTAGLSADAVDAALKVWSVDFVRRAAPYKVRLPSGRWGVDLSQSVQLAEELRQVEAALAAYQGGTRAGIRVAMGVTALADGSGLTPEGLAALRQNFSTAALELLKLLRK